MNNIFCDEIIVAAYRGTGKYDDMDDAASFLDCYHDLAYHVTKGERIVLETEHFYISLDSDGVSKSKKTSAIKEFERPGEWLDSFIHPIDGEPDWVDYEATLFIGERLLQVEMIETYYLLKFDNFKLKIIPHIHSKEVPGLDNDNSSYFYVYGAERHIIRKCGCGGEGELVLDFVSDYIVRCKKCKKSTWAQMNARDAIEEWNDGYTLCDASEIVIK